MTQKATRRWWPFDVGIPAERQSAEIKAKLAFLDEAVRRGFQAYVEQNDDCGAIAGEGRECLIVWRGQQRAEMLLVEFGEVRSKKLFTAPHDGQAFREASAEALAWLSTTLPLSQSGSASKVHPPTRGPR